MDLIELFSTNRKTLQNYIKYYKCANASFAHCISKHFHRLPSRQKM